MNAWTNEQENGTVNEHIMNAPFITVLVLNFFVLGGLFWFLFRYVFLFFLFVLFL